MALLWIGVICGGAGLFFAFLLWDSRYSDPPDLVYAVAATVLLVLGGVAAMALLALHGVAKLLRGSDR